MRKKTKLDSNEIVVTCIDCQDYIIASWGDFIECKNDETGKAINIPICKECGERYKKNSEGINSRIALIYRAISNKTKEREYKNETKTAH